MISLLERWIDKWTNNVEPEQCEYDLERGFGSSIDPKPCYLVLSDGIDYEYLLDCVCGDVYELDPTAEGKVEHSHDCQGLFWQTTLALREFGSWKQKKKRAKDDG
jgi:hypothetical protein